MVTGDALDTAKRVCSDLGLCTDLCVSGADLAEADSAEFERLVSEGSVFAKVTPLQKYTIVTTLQVGYPPGSLVHSQVWRNVEMFMKWNL